MVLILCEESQISQEQTSHAAVDCLKWAREHGPTQNDLLPEILSIRLFVYISENVLEWDSTNVQGLVNRFCGTLL